MSTSVLSQLVEVNSELSDQVSVLEAQISELQEKRKGIQTVIELFESESAPAAEAIATVTSTPAKVAKAKTSSKKAAKAKSTKAAAKAAAKAKVAKAAKEKTTKVKATRGRPAKAKAVEPKATTGKRSGRTANWQKYVQDSYSKSPLPDVIVGVLQAQPNHIFKIADVMNAVFKEDMPKTHFLKARNRVSNILSAGARDGDWFRGRGGTYSVSEKAIKSAG